MGEIRNKNTVEIWHGLLVTGTASARGHGVPVPSDTIVPNLVFTEFHVQNSKN